LKGQTGQVVTYMFDNSFNFPHTAPKGYHYEFHTKTSNLCSIWIVFDREFVYNSGSKTSCIWGFYDCKRGTYFAPINSKRKGKEVRIEDTSPYTAMPLNLSILEQCMV